MCVILAEELAELEWLSCVCRTLWITWSAGSANPTAPPATRWASTSGGAAGAAPGTCSYRRCPRDRRKKRGRRTETLSADRPLCPCWRLPVSPSPPTKTGTLFPFVRNLTYLGDCFFFYLFFPVVSVFALWVFFFLKHFFWKALYNYEHCWYLSIVAS